MIYAAATARLDVPEAFGRRVDRNAMLLETAARAPIPAPARWYDDALLASGSGAAR